MRGDQGDTRVIQISGQERYKRGDKSETLHCRLQILTTINSASATLLHRYVRYIVGRRFPAVSGNKMSYWLGQARCWWGGAMSRAGQHQGGHHHLHHQQYRYNYNQHYYQPTRNLVLRCQIQFYTRCTTHNID